MLRVSVNCFSKSGAYHVVGRRSENGPALLTAANIDGKMSCDRIVFNSSEKYIFPNRTFLRLKAKEIRSLWVDMPMGEVTVCYCTSEYTYDRSAGELLLYGPEHEEGEIAFNRPVELFMDGKPVCVKKCGNIWIGVYVHDSKPIRCSINCKKPLT